MREFSKGDPGLLTVTGNMLPSASAPRWRKSSRPSCGRRMEQAGTIQRSMLPSVFPAFPDRSEFEPHGSMIPAREVGRDVPLLPARSGPRLFVGDVSGKGLPRRSISVSRTLLRATARLEKEPGECLTHINASPVEQNTSGMFMTLLFGVLHLHDGTDSLRQRGTPPPSLVRGIGSCQLREKCGPMLGRLEGPEYRTEVRGRLAGRILCTPTG